MEFNQNGKLTLVDEYCYLVTLSNFHSLVNYWINKKDYKYVEKIHNIYKNFKGLFEVGPPETAIDIAAGQGCLDTIKYLYEQGIVSSTYQAMDNAASCGYLDIVKWLHENTDAGCKFALNMAIYNGHLDVVKYIKDNNIQKTDKYSVALALNKGIDDTCLIRYLKYN